MNNKRRVRPKAISANALICRVCGKPVDPKVDIFLSAGELPLFPVHKGHCRLTVTRGIVATRDVLEARYPLFKIGRYLIGEGIKAWQAAKQQNQE